MVSLTKDVLQHKLNVLRDHCRAIGRPYAEIEKTTVDGIAITSDGRDNSSTPEAAIEYFRGLAALGIDHAIVALSNVADLEPFDLLATRIIPEVEKIEVADR